MTKKEIKKATTSELIIDLALTNGRLWRNSNIIGMGTERLSNHLGDLAEELTARELLTLEDAELLFK